MDSSSEIFRSRESNSLLNEQTLNVSWKNYYFFGGYLNATSQQMNLLYLIFNQVKFISI